MERGRREHLYAYVRTREYVRIVSTSELSSSVDRFGGKGGRHNKGKGEGRERKRESNMHDCSVLSLLWGDALSPKRRYFHALEKIEKF